MSAGYDVLAETLRARGVDLDAVESTLRSQEVETPSWAYGNSGTRFAVFPQPGVPRDPFEKLEDAAQVHRHTGVAPSVALHIPWDRVDDFGALRTHAESLGLRLGAINPNLFQDPEYRLGSVCHPDAAVRRRAVDHLLECAEIAGTAGAGALSLWLADGTNYPGQDSFSARRRRLVSCLEEVVAALPDSVELLVEYKLYEPAFYATDLADWGSALLLCEELGDRAKVLVDLGPFQLFLIYAELVGAAGFTDGVRTTIDQSHNVEPKIEAMIQSVENLQDSYAKALIVDRAALAAAQADGDVLGGHRVLLDAFRTDVRPLCAKVRADLDASPDPVSAFRDSGYADQVAAARVGGEAAAWL